MDFVRIKLEQEEPGAIYTSFADSLISLECLCEVGKNNAFHASISDIGAESLGSRKENRIVPSVSYSMRRQHNHAEISIERSRGNTEQAAR